MAHDKYSGIPPLVKEYLFYLETIKGRSPRTIDGYLIDLKNYFRFLKLYKGLADESIAYDQIPIEDIDIQFVQSITLSDTYEFLHYVSRNRENAAITRSRKVSSIRGFFKYLTKKVRLLEENPIENLEVPSVKKSLPKYLSLEESMQLLNSVQTQESLLRDFCMITLFLNCGMRLSELVGINLNDIRDDTLRLLGKGNKERIVYLNQACVDSIADYLKNERSKLKVIVDKNALFLSSRGRRISARRVEQIVAQALKNAGLSNLGYSPHKLRHTAATLMYQHGNVDIRVLKDILGHENLGTTQIYTHVSSNKMEEAAKKNPLATFGQKHSVSKKNSSYTD